MSLYDYLQEFSGAVAHETAPALRSLLTINPPKNAGPVRAKFAEPNDVDLYSLPEKFHPVVRAYLRAMRSIYVSSDVNESFHNLNDLVVALNRAAESSTNWICPALINCSDELVSLYSVRAKGKKERKEKEKENQEGRKDDALELVAATINKSFKMCLTDKTLDFAQSKKSSIHFFLATLIKIYFKLHKLELAKSMEKALMGTGLAVPTIVNSPVEYRKHIVTYLYYSSLLSLDESDFAFAETKLLTALEFLACYKKPSKVRVQTEKILFLLAPLKLYTSRHMLKPAVFAEHRNIDLVYNKLLFPHILSGNLRQFDACVARLAKLFLKRHVYLLIVSLRNLCCLRLIQKTVAAVATMNAASPHIVPFSALQLAMDFALHNDDALAAPKSLETQNYAVSAEEVECVLANLIAKRWIKGYISHANKCIVLSKTEPFPN